jgi:nigerose phosphorylase
MMNWRIGEEGFDKERISLQGNKFLTGNGYLGIRGTLPEYGREEFAAVNLAGIYDRVGDGWREPLNAPNGLYTWLELDGVRYGLPDTAPAFHNVTLDYRHGLYERDTRWDTPAGALSLGIQRFASMEEKHLICMKLSLRVEGEAEVVLYTGIDGRVWDIHGPHYDEMELGREFAERGSGELIYTLGTTHENKDRVCVYESCSTDFDAQQEILTGERRVLRKLTFSAKAGVTYHLYKYISVYTSKDASDYRECSRELVNSAAEGGYEQAVMLHKARWEKLWSISQVTIEGDDRAMEALNYSLYHLHCIAPRHTKQLSIAARGLSGQTYKGAVFWDTEMFMLDFFLLTEPSVARTLLEYRIDTLPGAMEKARNYGYQGAFYAWESQEGGYDACSDYNVTDVFTGRQMRTYFKDKQIHISAAIVHGIMRYTDYTGSDELLAQGGAEVILECARFYYDLLVKKVNGEQYELNDVIGPDEYHERVNNNAYTNRMAKFTFDSALRVLTGVSETGEQVKERLKEQYDLGLLAEQFAEASAKLYIPGPGRTDGVIEQFDGYLQLEDASIEELKGRLLHEKEYWGGAYGIATHTKVIKQADVVTMLNLFSGDYSEEILLRNWEYYEPRTEHGSSLSACMYAILACKCHMPDKAYPFFMKSALSDLDGKGKEWAGLVYIGGTHPASSGGAYMTAIEGFAGIHMQQGELRAKSCLPTGWKRMSFHVICHGQLYRVEVTQENCRIIPLEEPA